MQKLYNNNACWIEVNQRLELTSLLMLTSGQMQETVKILK